MSGSTLDSGARRNALLCARRCGVPNSVATTQKPSGTQRKLQPPARGFSATERGATPALRLTRAAGVVRAVARIYFPQ